MTPSTSRHPDGGPATQAGDQGSGGRRAESPARPASMPGGRPADGGRAWRRRRPRRGSVAASALVLALAGAAAVGLPAGAGLGGFVAPAASAATAAGRGGQAVPVPCADVVWATCDTRATESGYQYRYRGGMLIPVPLDEPSGGTGGGCGSSCPPDPAAVCELLLAVGPSPDMSSEELAAYQEAIADCETWLSDPEGVPLADVQALLADYLREELLPQPTVSVQPDGRGFAGLPTIVSTPVPPAFTFNVDEPVLATISAVPTYYWTFGDGATGPNAPGRPYDPEISPLQFPDAYVAHSYDEPGEYLITLTVTWTGTFTVPGVAQAFLLDAVVLTASMPVLVEEATGVLVDNE